MKVGLLRFGSVPDDVAERVRQGLQQAFLGASCSVIDEVLVLPETALNARRGQYRSESILRKTQSYATQHMEFDRFLGVVDMDIFVPGLNFVFGEAQCPGSTALISLWRLKPEFYGAPADWTLFLERALKEAVHEVGHTLGLRHCPRASCVMHFSNSIVETDRKQSVFCDHCGAEVTAALSQLDKVS